MKIEQENNNSENIELMAETAQQLILTGVQQHFLTAYLQSPEAQTTKFAYQQMAMIQDQLTPKSLQDAKTSLIDTANMAAMGLAPHTKKRIPHTIQLDEAQIGVLLFKYMLEVVFTDIGCNLIPIPVEEELEQLIQNFQQQHQTQMQARQRQAAPSTSTTSAAQTEFFTDELTPIQQVLARHKTQDINIAFTKAANKGMVDDVTFLLTQPGLNIKSTTNQGSIALMLAKYNGHTAVVTLIEAALQQKSTSSLEM